RLRTHSAPARVLPEPRPPRISQVVQSPRGGSWASRAQSGQSARASSSSPAATALASSGSTLVELFNAVGNLAAQFGQGLRGAPRRLARDLAFPGEVLELAGGARDDLEQLLLLFAIAHGRLHHLFEAPRHEAADHPHDLCGCRRAPPSRTARLKSQFCD